MDAGCSAGEECMYDVDQVMFGSEGLKAWGTPTHVSLVPMCKKYRL
jgi:hypothetical protein